MQETFDPLEGRDIKWHKLLQRAADATAPAEVITNQDNYDIQLY